MEYSLSDYFNRFRGFFAVMITCLICWGITFLAIFIFESYGFFLFLGLPSIIGIIATLIYVIGNRTNYINTLSIAFISLVIYSFGLIIFAIEGLICLIMALPIAVFVTWFTTYIIFDFINNRQQINPTISIIILTVLLPVLMAFEASSITEDEIRSITTSIEINAPPEVVWKNVVEFPQLDEPTELIFKAGIAYPINAKIEGHGVGAVRHCNFSTGSFVEPITVWDEPNVLKFDVTEQPEPMKELSPYDIHPNHLHGYWVSKEGQFNLIRLPNGNTLLEGTTWYINKIKPDFYWTIWSDYIVHAIHERVLNHIKIQSEK